MDRYTKTVLTVIAVTLFWIAVRAGELLPVAVAAGADTRIAIADVSVSRNRPLPVVVSGELKCSFQ